RHGEPAGPEYSEKLKDAHAWVTRRLEQPRSEGYDVAGLHLGFQAGVVEALAVTDELHLFFAAVFGNPSGLGQSDADGHVLLDRVGARRTDLAIDVDDLVLGRRDIDLVARRNHGIL